MGLWKGLGPNIARNAIINAAELASYDQVQFYTRGVSEWLDDVVMRCMAPNEAQRVTQQTRDTPDTAAHE